MSSVLENELFIRCDLGPSRAKQLLIANSTPAKERFITQLLLYDAVVIPTNDFAILPVLLFWSGFEGLRALLDTGAVRFVRPDSLLCYVGGGEGLLAYRMIKELKDSERWEWWMEAIHTPDTPKAADLQLKSGAPTLQPKDRSTLVEQVWRATARYSFHDGPGCRSYADETYQDVLQCRTLRDEFARLCGYPRHLPPLSHLPGADPGSVRVLSPQTFTSPVDVVLWAADLNLQVRMATAAGGADLHGSKKARDVLKDKLVRSHIPDAKTNGFGRLLDIAGLPDVAPLVASGKVPFSEVLSIRELKAASDFRRWLANAEPKDARDLERLYVQSLGSIPMVSSLPMKIVRFALTTALGIIDPVIGLVAGAVDSFFVESWLGGYRPKLFFDQMHKKFDS